MTESEAYENYKTECETYFVTKFIDSDRIREAITGALITIFNLKKEPIKKGLIIHSKGYGQGKTMFYEVVRHRSKRLHNKILWQKTTAVQLCDIYAKNGIDALNKIIEVKDLFIDDLGKESTQTKHYGDDMNVLEYVLAKRYNLWIEKEYRTFTTTNLTIDQLSITYDGYIADRLLQMCEFIEFDFANGSFRQSKKTRILNEYEKPKIEKIVEKEKVLSDSEIILLDCAYWMELNTMAINFRNGKGLNEHWTDFRIMFDFLFRKGYAIPDATEKDKADAVILLKMDKKENAGKRESPKEVLMQIKAISEMEKQNVIKAVRAKLFFINLANNNHFFSESNALSKLQNICL